MNIRAQVTGRSSEPTAAVPAIGHNNPPEPISGAPLDLKAKLERDFADLGKTLDRLHEKVDQAPAKITNDVQQAQIGDLAVELNKFAKAARAKHKVEKDEFLSKGRVVDSFFKQFWEPAEALVDKLESLTGEYLRVKEARERYAREQIEAAARAEADKLIAAAEKAEGTATAALAVDRAIMAHERAEAAAEAAQAPVADLVRTRGESSLSSLRKEWVGEIKDLPSVDLGKLRPYLKLEEIERAVKAFIKAGGRECAGVRIYEKAKAIIR